MPNSEEITRNKNGLERDFNFDDHDGENFIGRWIRRIESLFFGLILGAIIVLGLLPVILRSFFETGVTWAEPLSRQLVLWIALFGAGAATRDRKHITIDIIGNFLSKRWKAAFSCLTGFLSMSICGILTWVSLRFVIDERIYEYPSAVFSNIPEWQFELVLLIGFFLLTLRFLAASIEDAIAFIRKPAEPG